MSKFYSIPGVSPYRKARNWGPPIPVNPRASEWYASRTEEMTTSPMTAGDECKFQGADARVLHSEYDQHTGEVLTYVQKSTLGAAGVHEVTWKQEDGPMRKQVISRTRPIHS